jgi:hypothetical protein
MITQIVEAQAETLAGLAADYPGWHIWRGRDGRGADKGWYATRQRRLRPEELNAGAAATLGADEGTGLRAKLAQQQVIEERATGVSA